jgi:hypothetical protein
MDNQSHTMVRMKSKHTQYLLTDNRSEMMVASHLAETSKIPYYQAYPPMPLPEKVMREAEHLTSATASSVGPLSQPLYSVARLLHQLGVTLMLQTQGVKVDSYVIGPLYETQYSLLQILQTQKETNNLSSKEWLLAQTFELYFEMGPRGMPPHATLLHVFVIRVVKALTPLLAGPEMEHPEAIRNAITWCLSLATIVAGWQNRPEHPWLKAHLQSHLQAMGLDKDEEKYYRTMDMFPMTTSFPWINSRTLYAQLRD